MPGPKIIFEREGLFIIHSLLTKIMRYDFLATLNDRFKTTGLFHAPSLIFGYVLILKISNLT